MNLSSARLIEDGLSTIECTVIDWKLMYWFVVSAALYFVPFAIWNLTSNIFGASSSITSAIGADGSSIPPNSPVPALPDGLIPVLCPPGDGPVDAYTLDAAALELNVANLVKCFVQPTVLLPSVVLQLPPSGKLLFTAWESPAQAVVISVNVPERE